MQQNNNNPYYFFKLNNINLPVESVAGASGGINVGNLRNPCPPNEFPGADDDDTDDVADDDTFVEILSGLR